MKNEHEEERWLIVEKKSGVQLGVASTYPVTGYNGKPRNELWVKRVVQCRSCGADIVFVATNTKKMMPVEAGTWHGELIYDSQSHVSHFALCPEAEKWKAHQKPRNK